MNPRLVRSKTWHALLCAAAFTMAFDTLSQEAKATNESFQTNDVKLRLTGVVTGKVNLAIIRVDNEKEAPFKVGSSIRPGITVLKVTPAEAIVSYRGMERRLELELSKNSSSPSSAIAKNESSKLQPAAAGVPPFKPRRAVTVSPSEVKGVGDGRWAIRRSFVDEELRSGELFNDARLVCDTVGRVRVIEIRPGSLYDRLGLKDGDILNDPSGNALKSVDGLLRFLYDQQTNSRPLRLQRVRDGAPSDLEIVFE